MAIYRSGDLNLAYDDIASTPEEGRVVLLIHGFASNRLENWSRLGWYGAFERAGYRIIAPDLRGHGESDKPHDPLSYDRAIMVADILALMDHLQLRRSIVMGYSMGAHLALAAALCAPQRIDRLILGGIGGRMLSQDVGARPVMTLAEALTAQDPDSIADPIQKGFRRFAEAQGDDRQALAACSEGRSATTSRDALFALSAPTLVVAGSLDQLAGDPFGLADAIPGAKAATLPGCDHFSAIPHALFKAAVFDFLEGWDDEGPVFE